MDKKERLRVAVHESIHGLLAMRCSTVHQVRCYPVGQTEVSFPFTPSSLHLSYRKRPEETHRRLIQVLGVITGPHIVQGSPLEAGDDVSDWQAAYNALKNADMHWRNVLDQVRAHVRTWYRTPGRADLVAKVAEALTKRAVVFGDKNWRALVASCQPARQTQRLAGSIDINRLVENIKCLENSYDWRATRYAGAGLVQSY
jgi:hypothetical protein